MTVTAWDRVKRTWEQADSFARSMVSRGVSGHSVDEETLHLRQVSCGILPDSAPCPLLRKHEDGTHHCSGCGCPKSGLSRLDGEGYTKLHYPFLKCPLKRPGFSNHEQGVFEQCFVINLARRPERLAAFRERMAAVVWPFPHPEVWSAVDGLRVGAPHWWAQGKGAWGCYQSHMRIIEHCLNNDVGSVLILEDDVVFHEDLAERWNAFYEKLPQDWEQLYLGGQHFKRAQGEPEDINEQVCIPYNVQRTHAYALRGEGLRKAYAHLLDTASWEPRHHIDHRFGVMHMRRSIQVYAPRVWMAGQEAGLSDIANKERSRMFWSDEGRRKTRVEQRRRVVQTDRVLDLKERIRERAAEKVIVAVLGPFRHGTSAVTGAIVSAGAHPGHRCIAPNKHNPKGFFEATMLQRTCQQMFPEPRLECAVTNREERLLRLGDWLNTQLDVPNHIIVGKHPDLCFLVDELNEMWPGVRFVSMYRNLDIAARSLNKIPPWSGYRAQYNEDIARDCIYRLHATREKSLAKLEENDEGGRVLRLQYDDMVNDPGGTLMPMLRFLGWDLAQYEAAVAFIDPALRREG